MDCAANPSSRNARLRALAQRAVGPPFALVARLRRFRTPSRLKRYDKLHFGSGARRLDGWANLDINGLGSLVWDLRKPLPLAKAQVRFVYTEHFIEHIERDYAVRLFSHARKVMVTGGVLRISTPDLVKLVDDYRAGQVVRMEHGGWFPETPCRMVNEGMRMWGHTFVYDESELVGLLRECGFKTIERVQWGQSEHPELRNLESRPDFADLIVEARV